MLESGSNMRTRMDPEQAQFFREKTAEAFKERPYLKNLHKRLLEIGGLVVVLWNGTNDEAITESLLQSGEARPGRKALLRLGEPSDCHENSARLHRKAPSRYEVRTGYALSRDGIWRPHSWVIDSKNDTIIETTQKRVTYFGVVKLAGITQQSAH